MSIHDPTDDDIDYILEMSVSRKNTYNEWLTDYTQQMHARGMGITKNKLQLQHEWNKYQAAQAKAKKAHKRLLEIRRMVDRLKKEEAEILGQQFGEAESDEFTAEQKAAIAAVERSMNNSLLVDKLAAERLNMLASASMEPDEQLLEQIHSQPSIEEIEERRQAALRALDQDNQGEL